MSAFTTAHCQWSCEICALIRLLVVFNCAYLPIRRWLLLFSVFLYVLHFPLFQICTIESTVYCTIECLTDACGMRNETVHKRRGQWGNRGSRRGDTNKCETEHEQTVLTV